MINSSKRQSQGGLRRFDTADFLHSDLFRISDFGFRISVRGLVLLGVCFCCSLSSGVDRSDSDSRTEVLFWSRPWWGDPAQYQEPGKPTIPALQWQEQRIAEFERAHSNIRVRREIDPGSDKLRLAFASANAP